MTHSIPPKNTPNISENLSPIQTALRDAKPPSIVHHRGDLNHVTVNGKKVYRTDFIYMEFNGVLKKIKTAPYDDHFVFRDTSVKLGWTLFCTCGSPAVVTGVDAYSKDASAQGALVVCYGHAQTGKHNAVNK